MSPITEPALLLLDKGESLSSRKAAGQAARAVGARKYGHLGTLDPFATGLLPVMLGRATRLAQYLPQAPKAYTAELQLGWSTTTEDREGERLETADLPSLCAANLDRARDRFTGKVIQRPPMFSAIRVDGQRAYKRARRGEAVVVPEREVEIHELTVQVLAPDRLALHVLCGTGTYIRSLARDLAVFLGSRGHLSSLRRTQVGTWAVEQAAALDELPERGVLGMDQAMGLCGQAVKFPPAHHLYFRQGRPLSDLPELEALTPGRYSLFCGPQAVALVEGTSEGAWNYCMVLPEAGHEERSIGA